MANNRMYLVYRPTGDAVFLGKRMGWGWYNTPDDLAERVVNLFKKIEECVPDGCSQDDFAIALEDGENHSHVIDDWNYSQNENIPGLTYLDVGDLVPYGGQKEYEK